MVGKAVLGVENYDVSKLANKEAECEKLGKGGDSFLLGVLCYLFYCKLFYARQVRCGRYVQLSYFATLTKTREKTIKMGHCAM